MVTNSWACVKPSRKSPSVASCRWFPCGVSPPRQYFDLSDFFVDEKEVFNSTLGEPTDVFRFVVPFCCFCWFFAEI